MKELFVYFEMHKVGTFRQNEDLIHSFQYDRDWLNNPARFQLSLALPLQDEPYGNRLTLSYFENLLPEGNVLDKIQSTQKVGGTFDFLAHYGVDCAGAVTIREPNNLPSHATSPRFEKFNMEKIYDAIDSRQSVASKLASENIYLSLAGAQDKFAATLDNNELYYSIDGAPTTHIVKVPIRHSKIKDSVYNEHFCLELAKEIGLPTAKSVILEGPHPLLIVERYDRTKDSLTSTRRLHQQDLCQAQGYVSDNKYENQGGPNLKQNYEFLKVAIPFRSRLHSLELFLKWVCFNLLIGNHDSHSKNFSLLLKGDRIEVAPFYDLLTTTIYPNLTSNFSFRIGGRDKFSEIGKNQFELQESELGLKRGVMINILTEMDGLIRGQVGPLTERMKKNYSGITVFDRINEEISVRRKGLLRQGLPLQMT